MNTNLKLNNIIKYIEAQMTAKTPPSKTSGQNIKRKYCRGQSLFTKPLETKWINGESSYQWSDQQLPQYNKHRTITRQHRNQPFDQNQ